MASTARGHQPPQDSVNAALAPKSRTGNGSTNRPKAPRKRRRGEVENPDCAAFATRVIRAHARRIANGDVDALTDLLRLADEGHQRADQGLSPSSSKLHRPVPVYIPGPGVDSKYRPGV